MYGNEDNFCSVLFLRLNEELFFADFLSTDNLENFHK